MIDTNSGANSRIVYPVINIISGKKSTNKVFNLTHATNKAFVHIPGTNKEYVAICPINLPIWKVDLVAFY